MNSSDYYHTIMIEREEDGWHTITYRVSDGFYKTIVVPDSVFTVLYNLMGKAMRATEDEKIFISTVREDE